MPPVDHRSVLTPIPREGDLGLVDALAQLTFAIHGTLGRIAGSLDLSIAQIRLLGILRDRRPTIKELAGFLQLDKSSVTGLVDRAQERGLVRRTTSSFDRRSVNVTITDVGQELIDQGTAAFEAEVAVLVAELSPAQRSRLSSLASHISLADARRRGVAVLGAHRVGTGSSSEP